MYTALQMEWSIQVSLHRVEACNKLPTASCCFLALLQEHSVASYICSASSVPYLTHVEAACIFMINNLLVDKSTWSALFWNSDHWLFSNSSEISLPSGLKSSKQLRTLAFKKIFYSQKLLPVISKTCLQETTSPKQLFAITIDPSRKKTKEHHWCSNKSP